MRKYQEILDIDSTYTPAVEELTYLRGKVAYLQKIRGIAPDDDVNSRQLLDSYRRRK
jgi:hypothetical protein